LPAFILGVHASARTPWAPPPRPTEPRALPPISKHTHSICSTELKPGRGRGLDVSPLLRALRLPYLQTQAKDLRNNTSCPMQCSTTRLTTTFFFLWFDYIFFCHRSLKCLP
jgi:hypothetical protein